MKFKLTILALAALLSSGCVYTRYEQHGTKMTRISLFGNQSVGRVDLMKGVVHGYESEQAQVAGIAVQAAVDAAVNAALKGQKP